MRISPTQTPSMRLIQPADRSKTRFAISLSSPSNSSESQVHGGPVFSILSRPGRSWVWHTHRNTATSARVPAGLKARRQNLAAHPLISRSKDSGDQRCKDRYRDLKPIPRPKARSTARRHGPGMRLDLRGGGSDHRVDVGQRNPAKAWNRSFARRILLFPAHSVLPGSAGALEYAYLSNRACGSATRRE